MRGETLFAALLAQDGGPGLAVRSVAGLPLPAVALDESLASLNASLLQLGESLLGVLAKPKPTL